ncbi:MAG: hypothetical protein ACI4JZ_08260 [Oscillospiraceae bacterium]
MSPVTKVVLELSAELVPEELSELSPLVKTTSVEPVDSVIELLVEAELCVELLEVSINGKLLVDEDFFASSVTFENRTMKTPVQSPKSTIIISMYITTIERGTFGIGFFLLLFGFAIFL